LDFVALVLGGGGCFFLWFATCCAFSRGTWRWVGCEVLLAAIAQSLSFLWFNTSLCHTSGNSCKLFWGSKSDIVSAVLWTVAAISVLCRYPVPRGARRGDGVWRNGAGRSNSSMAGGVPPGTDDTASVSSSGTAPRTTPSGEDPRQGSSAPLRSSSSKELKDVELT
jgi:hypothetical protein